MSVYRNRGVSSLNGRTQSVDNGSNAKEDIYLQNEVGLGFLGSKVNGLLRPQHQRLRRKEVAQRFSFSDFTFKNENFGIANENFDLIQSSGFNNHNPYEIEILRKALRFLGSNDAEGNPKRSDHYERNNEFGYEVAKGFVKIRFKMEPKLK